MKRCTRDLSKLAELPKEIEEEILSRLPVESLCRLRSVCKQWNTLFLSTNFNTGKWDHTIPSKKPWLLVWEYGENSRFWAYCFLTKTWKPSFSLVLRVGSQWYEPTSVQAGLFLLGSLYLSHQRPASLTICNPLTQTSIQLPAMSTITTVYATSILGGEGDHAGTYKIVALGAFRDEQFGVEIYDSSKKTWKMVGHMSRKWEQRLIETRDFIFCDSLFHCLVPDNLQPKLWGILSFSIEDDKICETPMYAELPRLAHRKFDDPFNGMSKLFTCGSKVLFACWKTESFFLSVVIIWELQRGAMGSNPNSPLWKEMTRMPATIIKPFKRLQRISKNSLEWAGLYDCVYVKAYGCEDKDTALNIAVYNITENSWTCLPRCSMPPRDARYSHLTGFTPRLDMKVM